ncbi:MAG: 3D domain-containing protein [bacterium]|nr:3D domain-containing protein [bacterium]
MKSSLKCPNRGTILLITCLIFTGILLGLAPIFESKNQGTALADLFVSENSDTLVIIEGNSLLPITDPSNPEPKIIKKLRVVVTGYSSTEDQTDSEPFITAAGTQVREGIIANNLLPFGTKIKLPELYGENIFVVEDRMNWKKGYYHVDIWFPSYWEALNFGAKRTYIEVLEG